MVLTTPTSEESSVSVLLGEGMLPVEQQHILKRESHEGDSHENRACSKDDNDNNWNMEDSDPQVKDLDKAAQENNILATTKDVLDVDKLIDLLQANKSAVDRIAGKDVLLLIGGTGAGKVSGRYAFSAHVLVQSFHLTTFFFDSFLRRQQHSIWLEPHLKRWKSVVVSTANP